MRTVSYESAPGSNRRHSYRRRHSHLGWGAVRRPALVMGDGERVSMNANPSCDCPDCGYPNGRFLTHVCDLTPIIIIQSGETLEIEMDEKTNKSRIHKVKAKELT